MGGGEVENWGEGISKWWREGLWEFNTEHGWGIRGWEKGGGGIITCTWMGWDLGVGKIEYGGGGGGGEDLTKKMCATNNRKKVAVSYDAKYSIFCQCMLDLLRIIKRKL